MTEEREITRRAIGVYLVCGVVLAIVTAAIGSISVVAWLWNAGPVLGATLVCLFGSLPKRRPSTSAAFLLGTAGVTVAFHLAWLVDLQGFQTGSSTSGLIFIFVPFSAVGAGTVCAALAFAFGRPV